jgi:Subtilase family
MLASGVALLALFCASAAGAAVPANSAGPTNAAAPEPSSAATLTNATSNIPTPATSPLPPSDYRVRNVCRAPGPGRASCLAQVLVPATAAARARLHPLGMTLATPLPAPSPEKGSYGLRPEDLKDAYFPGEPAENVASKGQTIALIEAYNDLNAEADLKTYGEAFEHKLPTLSVCPAGETKEDCFEKVNQEGKTSETGELPFPETPEQEAATQKLCEERPIGSEPTKAREEKEEACELVEEAAGWSLETSLDIEMAHATCQNCRIVLVEADSTSDADLETAEDTAAKLVSSGGVGATEISNSWGGEGPARDSSAFKHPGVVITAAAGDSGYLNWTEAEEARALRTSYYSGAEYPASSPHVVAVGGTSLTLSRAGAWQSETAWNDDHSLEEENVGAGGSGCSLYFQAPEWQRTLPNWSAVGCESRRAVTDVSADGDPYTGVAVYDSEGYCEYSYERETKVVRTPWCTIGGTSVGTPLIAAMYALAGGSHRVEYPARTLYEHLETNLLHTVTGSNGECDGDYSSGCTGSMNPESARFPFDCGQGVLICNAAPDCAGDFYAGPTGVGSPNGIAAFDPAVTAAKIASACPHEAHEEGPSSSDSPSPSTSVSLSPTTPPISPKTTAPKPVVSHLTLTRTATIALKRYHARPAMSKIAFAFTLNVPARVQVKLARRIRVHGHIRWRTLRGTLRIDAKQGRDRAHLRARRRLAPGLYRLTVTPADGKPRTLTFRVG